MGNLRQLLEPESIVGSFKVLAVDHGHHAISLDEHALAQTYLTHPRCLTVIDNLNAGNLLQVVDLGEARGWSILRSQGEKERK